MRLEHPARPDQSVRLGYCLNVHPAETLAGVLQGLHDTAAPVARAMGGAAPFGVGPWFAGPLAARLAGDRSALASLRDVLIEEHLMPFTFNAFPFGGFHRPGLKAAVFRPTWLDPARSEFTHNVAQVAARLAEVTATLEGPDAPGPAHVSVSTHCGGFGDDVCTESDQEAVASALATTAGALAALEELSGVRIVLSLEPEPRSSVNDTAHLPALFSRARRFAPENVVRRHLGSCLDACHAAVEFEEPEDAFLAATADGHPLGKLQFSSALSLPNPAHGNNAAQLFDLAEDTFLHQVTGHFSQGLVRADDLPAARALWLAGDSTWRACDELRCHFHVPVDLDRLPGSLRTTRSFADRLLDIILDHPERWGSPELHVEVETYTWDILPPQARARRDLHTGLEHELTHVLERLTAKGWSPT